MCHQAWFKSLPSRLPRVSRQLGGIALPFALSFLILGASSLLLQALTQTRQPLLQQQVTEQRMARIEKALKAYWLSHQCASLPSTPLGLGSSPAPEVPWRELGLQEDDKFDAWGRLLTFRQASAGMTVSGVPVRWAVISHGPTGLGAWLPTGGQKMPVPAAGNVEETANIQSATAMFRLPFFAPSDLDPAVATNHFDDVVRFGPSGEWTPMCTGSGTPPVVAAGAPSVTLDSGTLATSGVTFSGFSSGQQTLTIPGSGGSPAVTLSSQAGQQIAFDNTGNPKTGLGVCGSPGPCNAANSELTGSETLSFKLTNASAYKLGLLVENFSLVESVQITFKLNGIQVGAVVNHTGAANASNLTPTLPSAAFDEVVIGAGAASSFFIDAVRFCDANTPCTP
jgi:hypothetical protein